MITGNISLASIREQTPPQGGAGARPEVIPQMLHRWSREG